MSEHQRSQFLKNLKSKEQAQHLGLPQIICIFSQGKISISEADQFILVHIENEFQPDSELSKQLKMPWDSLSLQEIQFIIEEYQAYKLKEDNPQPSIIMQVLAHSKKTEPNDHLVQKLIQSLKDLKHSQENSLYSMNELKVSKNKSQKSHNQKEILEKYQKGKEKVLKKLLIVFDYFRKEMFLEGESFEKNHQISEYLDIKIFMKYFKQFKINEQFPSNLASSIFKKIAINTIWLDFDRFVNLHFELVHLVEELTVQQKYKRLKIISEFLSSDKIKKMLNINLKVIVANIVQGHTGSYKQDIINRLEEKSKQRKQRMNQRYKRKSIITKTEERDDSYTNRKSISFREKNHIKSNIQQLKTEIETIKYNKRVKSEQSFKPSIYQELKLPKLRVRQLKQQSIYQSLENLKLGQEKLKIKSLFNQEEHEEFLSEYLKGQKRINAKATILYEKKKKIKAKQIDLPTMKFS